MKSKILILLLLLWTYTLSVQLTITPGVPNSQYRIAEHDLDGRVRYTSILRSSCNATDVFNLWPNPAHDMVFVNIVAANESQAMIKVFDSKGAGKNSKNICFTRQQPA